MRIFVNGLRSRLSRPVTLACVGSVTLAIVGLGTARLAGEPQRSGATSQRRSDTRPVVEVYKSPTCGCCVLWGAHLEEHGFTVRTHDVADLAVVKSTYRVPRQAESCHTAVVDGYVVEGHVPAADVQRLLAERPAIAGLAVPGMPIGSPGMEVPGVAAQPYDVLAFDKDGGTRVFARHR